MYQISERTRRNLEKSFGTSLSVFNEMSADEIRDFVEPRKQKEKYKGQSQQTVRRKARSSEDLDRISRKLFGI